MKTSRLLVFLIFVSPCIHCQTTSSETISPSGGSFDLGDVVVSWTIGENILDFSEPGFPTSLNIHETQPDFIEFDEGIFLRVYPTVTEDVLHLLVQSDYPVSLQAELLDLKLTILQVIAIETAETTINLGWLKSGLFLLKVSDASQNAEVIFKIIKD